MYKSAFVAAVAVIALLGGAAYYDFAGAPALATGANATVVSAFQKHIGHIEVTGTGRVTRILPDDTRGSRHQRFILRIAPHQTILIAHNIDLAPRLPQLARGDRVRFHGEYEWNPQGGVVHWTHRDPAGRHPAGWLEHDGKKVQ